MTAPTVNPNGNLKGKIALVTGASRGIGEAIAVRLAMAGAKVVCTARTAEAGESRLPGTLLDTINRIRAAGGDATFIKADLSKAEDRERLVADATAAYGPIDILVNNAAVTFYSPIESFARKRFDLMIEIQVWAALHLVIGLPLNRLLVPRSHPPAPSATTEHAAPAGVPWTMIILAGVFGATWFVSTALAAHLPRLLQAMGATPEAAIAAGALVGPAQVAARVAEFSLLRHAAPMISARLAAGLHPIGALLLAVIGAPAAVPFVLLHGAGNGLLTIARGTLPLALFGAAGYGLRTGLLAAPARLLQGAAPLLFGLVLDRGGPYAALMLTGCLTGLSCVALLWLRPKPSPAASSGPISTPSGR